MLFDWSLDQFCKFWPNTIGAFEFSFCRKPVSKLRVNGESINPQNSNNSINRPDFLLHSLEFFSIESQPAVDAQFDSGG